MIKVMDIADIIMYMMINYQLVGENLVRHLAGDLLKVVVKNADVENE